MDLIFKAIALNNEGARLLLQSGCTLDAVQMMREAVNTLKEIPLGAPATATSTSQTEETDTTATTSQCAVSSWIVKPPAASTYNDKEDETMLCASPDEPPSQDYLLYVHSRPMFISVDDCLVMFQNGYDISSVVHTASTFVIFNLALACQHFGTASGTEAPLQRAMELYDVVLGSHVGSQTSSLNRTMAVMQCLALNNLAHLHYDYFCEYEYSQYCMAQMYDLMAQTGCLDHIDCEHHDDDNYNSNNNALTTFEAEEIRLNVLYTQPPATAGAA